MNINRQTLRLYDCLDLVLRIEVESRRSILDMSSARFLGLAREGEDALYARADAVRAGVATAEKIARETREFLTSSGAEASEALDDLCTRLEDALDDLEDRAVYAPYRARESVTVFPVAQSLSDAECEAAWTSAESGDRD